LRQPQSRHRAKLRALRKTAASCRRTAPGPADGTSRHSQSGAGDVSEIWEELPGREQVLRLLRSGIARPGTIACGSKPGGAGRRRSRGSSAQACGTPRHTTSARLTACPSQGDPAGAQARGGATASPGKERPARCKTPSAC